MERGGRPETQDDDDDDQPQLSFSGSIVFPAGYDNQIIVKDHKQTNKQTKNEKKDV